MSSRRLGVVLFQLGGPDSIDAIEPFLFNLFSDPEIIDFPLARLAREPLARLIAGLRSRHVAHHYGAIGGKSPILEFTRQQAEALERELRRDFDARVVIAMRYWGPTTEQAVLEMASFGPDRIVLLPLYPQYSKTTTGSSVREWNRLYSAGDQDTRTDFIRDYHDDPAYIYAITTTVDNALAGFGNPAQVEIVFTAHSVPVAVIESGDPYQRQIERTVELVSARGGWPCGRHLCYQSRVGPLKWLRPSLRERLESLAAAGARRVLIVPISFVSDHVETLYEIDIEHRAIAERAGIADYRMMPGLNNSPRFVAALAGLVRRAVASSETTRGAAAD